MASMMPAYEPHELAAKLREVLDGRAPHNPALGGVLFTRPLLAQHDRTASIETPWNEFLPISIPQQPAMQVIGFIHILSAQNVPHRGRFLPRRASSDTDSPVALLCFLSVA